MTRDVYIPPPPDGCKKLALATVALLALLLVALVDTGGRYAARN